MNHGHGISRTVSQPRQNGKPLTFTLVKNFCKSIKTQCITHHAVASTMAELVAFLRDHASIHESILDVTMRGCVRSRNVRNHRPGSVHRSSGRGAQRGSEVCCIMYGLYGSCMLYGHTALYGLYFATRAWDHVWRLYGRKNCIKAV